MVKKAAHFVLGIGCFLMALSCWGCPVLPLLSIPCRSQCELCASVCFERSIDEFPDFNTKLMELRSKYANRNCEDLFIRVVAGECSDGKLFLSESDGFVSESRYFNVNTLTFVGLATSTDCIDPLCLGRGYLPVPMVANNNLIIPIM